MSRGLARRVVRLAVRPVRSIVRPLLFRLRLFLTGEVIREMGDLRAKQDLTLGHLRIAGTRERAEPFALDGGAAQAMCGHLLVLARRNVLRTDAMPDARSDRPC